MPETSFGDMASEDVKTMKFDILEFVDQRC